MCHWIRLSEEAGFMLADAIVRVLLTQVALFAASPKQGAAVVCVDRDREGDR
jgi:hypothetical protein